jgi:rhodanese-related sulfurtransferase
MPRQSIQDLVNATKENLEELSVTELQTEISSGSCTVVDIRDFRERLLDGTIPGAVSAPRGMLEWWFDPDSPYHREEFAIDGRYVFFCSLGWRSALATAAIKNLGFENVAHLEDGFTGWVQSEQPVEDVSSGGKWFRSKDDIAESFETGLELQ